MRYVVGMFMLQTRFLSRFTNHLVNSWNSVGQAIVSTRISSVRSSTSFWIKSIKILLATPDGSTDFAMLLNFMGAASCVYTVRPLRERVYWFSSRSIFRPPYHSVLSNLLPPGLPSSPMVSRLLGRFVKSNDVSRGLPMQKKHASINLPLVQIKGKSFFIGKKQYTEKFIFYIIE